MKLKVMIGTVIAALVCGAAAVFAEPVINVEDGSVCAVLTGSIDLRELGYDDAQIKNRVPYSPMQVGISVSDPETNTTLYRNQVTADGGGDYSAKFILAEDAGTYNIKISTSYCVIYDGEIEYRDGTVNELNKIAAGGDNTELSAYLNSYAKYMGIDMSLFNQYTDEEKAKVISSVAANAPYEKKADTAAAMRDAVLSAGLTSESLTGEEKSRMLYDYLDSLGEEYEPITEFIKKYDMAVSIIRLKNEEEYSSIKDGIYELALRVFLSDNVKNIYDLEVVFDSGLFSIPSSTMEKYKSCANKTEFFTVLFGKIGTVKSLSDLYAAADQSFSEIKASPEPTRKPNSGGGGGGGGFNSITVPSVPTATPKPEIKPTAAPSKTEFSDMDGYEWAKEAVEKLADKGIINGSGDGKFLPKKNITREEYAKIIAGAFELKQGAGAAKSFADVCGGAWYYAAVAACAGNGVINGISETEFGVGRYVTRQDAAAMLQRILKAEPEKDGKAFADDAEIADYAKEGVYALRNAGILNGYDDNNFKPELLLSRAEAAKMIYAAIQLGGE